MSYAVGFTSQRGAVITVGTGSPAAVAECAQRLIAIAPTKLERTRPNPRTGGTVEEGMASAKPSSDDQLRQLTGLLRLSPDRRNVRLRECHQRGGTTRCGPSPFIAPSWPVEYSVCVATPFSMGYRSP